MCGERETRRARAGWGGFCLRRAARRGARTLSLLFLGRSSSFKENSAHRGSVVDTAKGVGLFGLKQRCRARGQGGRERAATAATGAANAARATEKKRVHKTRARRSPFRLKPSILLLLSITTITAPSQRHLRLQRLELELLGRLLHRRRRRPPARRRRQPLRRRRHTPCRRRRRPRRHRRRLQQL